MATIQKQRRPAQLVLFGERVAVPHWCDLAKPTRVEVVRLLAQLLLSVQADNPGRPQKKGESHE
jgi:hypothetical protein